MRIALVIGSLGNMGGLEKVSVILANELVQNYEVDLISFSNDKGYYPLDLKLNVIEKNINYTFLERAFRKICNKIFKSNSLSNYKEIFFLREILKKNDYDVIIASDGNQCMCVNDALLRQKKVKSIKLIGWMHNDYDVYFNNYYKNYKKKLSTSLTKFNNIVTLTDNSQLEYKIHNKNTIRIYNPLTLEKTKQSNLENKEIIFVSRLVKEQKGLDFLIEIAKKIKSTDWKIRVIGDGEDSHWLKCEIKENNLQNVIILHGAVTNNIQDIYSNASLFISTSRWEGFGLVLTEAMACGLPVVAFENSGPNEILNHGQYGILIPKYDTSAFANTLIRLIGDPNELEYYSKKSLERANDFSLKHIVEQWKKIIED